MNTSQDSAIRIAVFGWLKDQVAQHGEVLPWQLLSQGFRYQGERVPLAGPQGIFKPKVCRLPLTILTSHGGPYSDSFSADGLLHYDYRGTDPQHHENVGLHTAMIERVPLVYLHGHVRGRYHVIFPVFIVGADPKSLSFTVEARDLGPMDTTGLAMAGEIAEPHRAYGISNVRRRLHQQGFRELVLHAYGERCALCRLRHRELLDAAHIVPDSEELGEPRVPNGLTLCKIHHAAFDSHILTVNPDYKVVVRPDILEETDGPMLRYGIQELDGKKIITPRRPELRPEREGLEWRWAEFLKKVS